MRAIVIRKGKHRYDCANTDRSPFLLHFLAVFFNLCLFLISLVTLSLSFNYLSFYSVHLSFYSLHLSFYSLHFFFFFLLHLSTLSTFLSIQFICSCSFQCTIVQCIFQRLCGVWTFQSTPRVMYFIHGERKKVQFQVSFVRARMHTILKRMDLDIV